MKVNDRYKISRIFLLGISVVISNGFAGFAQAENSRRDAIIEKELACIAASNRKHQPYSWADVCYTKEEPSSPDVWARTEETVDKTRESNEWNFKFDMSGGYRNDDLKFNIAGNVHGSDPNILSELTWSNLQSYQIRTKGEINYYSIVFQLSGAYAQILKGKNQDSDYFGDNRTIEVSRSNNNAGKGYMDDVSAGLGYKFNLDEHLRDTPFKEVFVTPLAGYSRNAQNLRLFDGFQTLDPYSLIGFTGPFAGLKSRYDAQWFGPWIGTELGGKFQRFSVSLRAEYHMMKYRAQADWNLRSEYQHPKSYTHSANAAGYRLNAGMGYDISDHWQLNLDLEWDSYKTDNGIDRVYLSDGSTASTRLNVVEWSSYSINAGLKYSWL